MSFRCQISGKKVREGKPNKIIIHTRDKHYVTTYVSKRGKRRKKFTVESDGWEIVEEKIVCNKVYYKMLRNGEIDDKGILRGSHGRRLESSQLSENKFREEERNSRPKRRKVNQTSSRQRTPNSV